MNNIWRKFDIRPLNLHWMMRMKSKLIVEWKNDIEVDFSNKKTIEFTFEKRRHEIERRVYLFDTLQDRKVWSNQRREYPLFKEFLLGISGRDGKISGQANSHRNSHGFHQLSSGLIGHFSSKSSILLLF